MRSCARSGAGGGNVGPWGPDGADRPDGVRSRTTVRRRDRVLFHPLAGSEKVRTVGAVDLLDQLTRRLLLLHEQMEQLVCALDIQQLVLTNNRLRWLPAVTENVEVLVDEIQQSEAERAPIARAAASMLGVSADSSLAELSEAAGEPYRSGWRRTRLQLVSFQQEIELITATNRDLGQHGVAAANDVIAGLGDGPEPTSYSATGRSEPVRPASHRFNRTA